MQLAHYGLISPDLYTQYFVLRLILMGFAFMGMILMILGAVRRQNSIDIVLKSVTLYALTSILFLLFSYHLIVAYQTAVGAFFPKLSHSAKILYHWREPELAQLLYQAWLMILMLMVIVGAGAERMKFSALLLFSLVMITVIYPLVFYWQLPGRLLDALGFMDVSQLSSLFFCGATAGLIVTWLLQPRRAHNDQRVPMRAHNMSLFALGALFMLLGFLGLNLGGVVFSPVKQSFSHGVHILINTQLTASMGFLTALVLNWLLFGAADLSVALNALVAALLAISAEPLAYSMGAAVLAGMGIGILVPCAVWLFNKSRLDDPAGVLSMFGVGAIWSLMNVVATQDYVALTKSHQTLWGFWHQLFVQICGIIAIFVWVGVASLVVLLLLRLLIGIRVDQNTENLGLDLAYSGINSNTRE